MSIRNHPARLAALAAGAVTFDTGVPCINGHNSPRNTANTFCLACDYSAVRGARRRLAKRAARMRVTMAKAAALDASLAAALAANKAAYAARFPKVIP